MPHGFIYTSSGWLNVDRVDEARFQAKGNGYSIIVDGKIVDTDNVGFPNTIVGSVPVQGEWECLYYSPDDDTVIRDPVIAWALTITGNHVPVTPMSMDGEQQEHALKLRGSDVVYDCFGSYASEDEWKAKQSKEKPRAA